MILDKELFDEFIEKMPLLCVDGLVISQDKILLLKRNDEPAKGEWWFPGGRVFKNETLETSIIRKLKEETNLDVRIERQLCVYETIFEKKHTVNICYVLSCSNSHIKLNDDHSEFNWFELKNLPTVDERVYQVIKNYLNS